MSKSKNIRTLTERHAAGEPGGPDPRYRAYFACFCAGEYYQAHDVLEHLWLECRDANRAFYKGLIQFAGAFVHLRKHYEHPSHPTHGRRLQPAARLLDRSLQLLDDYPPHHLGLDLDTLRSLANDTKAAIARGNPWSPHRLPQLRITG